MLHMLVGERDEIIRRGLQHFLRDEFEVGRLGLAGDETELQALCRDEAWDIVLLDAGLGGADGLPVLRWLRQEWPSLPVVLLVFYIDPLVVRAALDLGASSLVAKDDIAEDIAAAVQASLAGQTFLSPVILDELGSAPGAGK